MALSCEEQMEFNKSGEIFLSDLQKTLYEKLLCPICLDLIKNTMTTVECLHRFCSDCIVKSLQSGNEQCPVCSTKIELKKNLKSDPKFDTLISMIFPSRGMYKAFQNKVKEDFNECREENEIELVLRVHPSPNLIDSCVKISRDVVRYVKADDHTTINHLRKYLTMRLSIDVNQHFSSEANAVESYLYAASGNGQFVLLNGDLTLKEVTDKFWKEDRPLELYYMITKNS